MTTMDEDTRLKLLGLKAIANDLNKQMDAVRGTVTRLVGGGHEDETGWASDFCWDEDISVEKLWDMTEALRRKPAA